MSEYENVTGKLVEIHTNGNIEETAKTLCKSHGYDTLPKYCDTWVECLREELFDGYVSLKGKIFKVAECKPRDYGDIFKSYKNLDGSISFVVSYYNGSCSFSEALEYALTNMENE